MNGLKIIKQRIKETHTSTKVEKLQYPEGEFWKSKMPQC